MKKLLLANLTAMSFLLALLACSSFISTPDNMTAPDNGPANQGTGGNYPARADCGGKYYRLLQVLNCPGDQGSYGSFHEYGPWSGNSWCGQQARSGYWVYVAPNWYIWGSMR